MIDTEIKSLLRVKDVEIQVETIGRTVRAGVLEDDNNVETQYINEATAAAATMMEKLDLITYSGTDARIDEFKSVCNEINTILPEVKGWQRTTISCPQRSSSAFLSAMTPTQP